MLLSIDVLKLCSFGACLTGWVDTIKSVNYIFYIVIYLIDPFFFFFFLLGSLFYSTCCLRFAVLLHCDHYCIEFDIWCHYRYICRPKK